MRLAAQAKMGYYPTTESTTPNIAKYTSLCERNIIVFNTNSLPRENWIEKSNKKYK